MLTAGELACLQGSADDFPETVLVKRSTRTSDGAGGTTTTLATVATVKGLLGPANATEQTLGDRDTHVARWAITVKGGTDVRPKDQLVITAASPAAPNGLRTFDVVNPGGPRSLEVLRRVIVVEVT